MRRGVLLACLLAVLCAVVLWGWDRQTHARRAGRTAAPRVVAGRELPAASGRRTGGSFDDTRVDDADVGIVRCSWPGADGAWIQAWRLDEGWDDAPHVSEDDRTLLANGTVVRSGPDLTLRLQPGPYGLSALNADDRLVRLGALEVEAGRVYACTVDGAPAPVTGTVVARDGSPVGYTMVFGCGETALTGEDGTFVLESKHTACSVEAEWRDGALSRRSERVDVSAFARTVELVLDTRPIAGLGIGFAPGDEGATVTSVREGSPAERAGLEEGDVITEVDGTSTAGMAVRDFVETGTGPVGTEVSLVVVRDGRARTVDIVRAHIPAEVELDGPIKINGRVVEPAP